MIPIEAQMLTPPFPEKWSNSLLKNPSPRGELGDSLYHLESPETIMRGKFADQGGLFSYIAPDKRCLLYTSDAADE